MTRLLSFGLCALSVSACGGTDEGRPDGTRSSSEPVDQCELARGFEFLPVVDFDPPPGETPATVRVQRCAPTDHCYVNYNYDSANTPGMAVPEAMCPDVQAFSEPDLNASFLLGRPAGDRCGEPEYAVQIVASNLAVCTNEQGRQGWGGSLSFTYADSADRTLRLDASEWDGISFWVKRRSAASRTALNFSAADGYTAGYENIPNPFGGEPESCNASGDVVDMSGRPIADTEKCDGFGVSVTLADDWTFVPVRFASMRQKGFGMPSPVGRLVTEELVRLQILVSAGDWDLWIDDIAYFREVPP
jgi:hypothetical protein